MRDLVAPRRYGKGTRVRVHPSALALVDKWLADHGEHLWRRGELIANLIERALRQEPSASARKEASIES